LLVTPDREGKIKYLGISACSPQTLHRACAIDHIDAYQVEYSPWSLDIEEEGGKLVLEHCRELGIALFAYSPLGRGMVTGQIKSPDDLEPTDMRKIMPRFSPENFSKNLVLVDRFKSLAGKKDCTPGQLCIAWLMAQGNDIFPIPGTKNIKYLEENVGAVRISLAHDEVVEIRTWINQVGVAGLKSPPGLLAEFNDTPPL
jgi:aryl-alcohol dehydrogenase-like predicted oxidoreductase